MSNYSKYSDLELLYALEDCEDIYCFDTTCGDNIDKIRYIISMRQKLGLWDYSAEVEYWAFHNEVIKELCARGI